MFHVKHSASVRGQGHLAGNIWNTGFPQLRRLWPARLACGQVLIKSYLHRDFVAAAPNSDIRRLARPVPSQVEYKRLI